MAAEFEVEITIAVDPGMAWEVVGHPCGVTRWYPLYTGCRVDADVRTLERADGAVVVERLLGRDEEAMTYSYSVISGLPLAEHEASFQVVPCPSGARVIWRTRAIHDDASVDMEERLADRQRDALQGLKALLEGAEQA